MLRRLRTRVSQRRFTFGVVHGTIPICSCPPCFSESMSRAWNILGRRGRQRLAQNSQVGFRRGTRVINCQSRVASFLRHTNMAYLTYKRDWSGSASSLNRRYSSISSPCQTLRGSLETLHFYKANLEASREEFSHLHPISRRSKSRLWTPSCFPVPLSSITTNYIHSCEYLCHCSHHVSI